MLVLGINAYHGDVAAVLVSRAGDQPPDEDRAKAAPLDAVLPALHRRAIDLKPTRHPQRDGFAEAPGQRVWHQSPDGGRGRAYQHNDRERLRIVPRPVPVRRDDDIARRR